MQKNRLFVAALIAGACSLVVAGPLHAADEQFGKFEPGEIPRLQPASDAAAQAMLKMKLSQGLKVSLFAAEPMLANPVALTFDDKGRCYVVDTWRFEHGVIDMRSHQDWLADDLACKTVEDRMALVRRKMGPNARSFGKYPDVVRLLQDTNGDGNADKSTVFAEFHGMADGVAAGITVRDGNVYLTDIPNLWLLKDTTGNGKADVIKSLSYGYGVRYNYLGHDLHGPRFGPDGKLYFTIGDRGANIEKSVDGSHVENIESGSVFRCNADGSHLEIYATGLRNPQCLGFDEYGNLFTGDNNPDYGDPARWVYIVEGGDSGWRIGYQWDHNPVGGGPWMWEHLWETQDKSNAMYLIPPVADMGAGPSGVAYYPGTGLSHEYDRHFFECDFRGGFTGSGVHTFTMEPDGAGFKMAGLHDFIWDTLATDIAFGPGGGAYVTDWVSGWHVSGLGRIYHIYDPQAMADPIVKQVKDILFEGFKKRSSPELIKLLAHVDQRVRQQSQFELADRGAAVVPLLVASMAASNPSQLARIHSIWALGQIANATPAVLDPVVPILGDKDAEIRAQAARVLGDHDYAKAYDGFIKMLDDSNLRDRYFAAMGLSKLGRPQALGPIINMIRDNADKDAYLRHAGVMALTRLDDFPAIEQASKDSSQSVRLAALLAMRLLKSPQVAQFLHDSDPQLVLEAARAINDVTIPEAMPQLAAMISDVKLPNYVMTRVVNANYRLGTAASASALAHFAADPKAPQQWRVEALEDLADWRHPGRRDKITNLQRPLPDRDPAVARDAVGPELPAILNGAPDKVRVAGLSLIQKLGVKDSTVLVGLAGDTKLAPDVRVGAIAALAAQNDAKLPQTIDAALHDSDDHVRAAAIGATAKLPDAIAKLDPLLNNGSVLDRQAAFAALGQVPGKQATDLLAGWMDKLAAHQVEPALELDVLEAAGKRNSPPLADKIRQYNQSLGGDEHAAYHLGEFKVALEGGDPSVGDHIFHDRTDASCLRCHTIQGRGGIVGPVLDGIGSRQNRQYLLESIIHPNAKIAKGFEGGVVRLKNGKTVIGVVRKDTEHGLEIIDAEGHKISIKKSDIQSRERGQSAMPEGYDKILSKEDIRNLVAYLASLKN